MKCVEKNAFGAAASRPNICLAGLAFMRPGLDKLGIGMAASIIIISDK